MKTDHKRLALGLVMKHGGEEAKRIATQSLEASKRSDNAVNIIYYENVLKNIELLETAKNKGENNV